MGQKIHPYGYRVGITQPHSVHWFANKYQYPQYVFEDFLLRQSLFKLLPFENLPRQRSEETSEIKLVRIKIERLIRNTIKIKLYITNPESIANLFDVDSSNKNKKELLNSKIDKRTLVSKLESKRDLVTNDRNLLLSNILKKSLKKKITKLHILKLQNTVYKLETFKNCIGINQPSISSEKSSLNKFTVKNTLKLTETSEINEINDYIIVNNLSSYYSSMKNLIYGLKLCLNNNKLTSDFNSQINLNSLKKLKLKFQLILLKQQLCNSIVNQYEIYSQFEKQKLLNSNNFQDKIKETKILTDSRFLKLNQFNFNWKSRSLQATKNFYSFYSRLKLKLENLYSDIDKNKEFSVKLKILIDILKVQYLLINKTLKKPNSNSFLVSNLNKILTNLKIKSFSIETHKNYLNKIDAITYKANNELQGLILEKEKMCKLVNSFKLSNQIFTNKLIKTKFVILAICYINSKLLKLNFKFSNLKLLQINNSLSEYILKIKNTEKILKKNQQVIKNLVLIKTKQIKKFSYDIEKNCLETKILLMLEDISDVNNLINISKLYRKYIDLNKSSFNIEFLKHSMTNLFSIIRYKIINTGKSNSGNFDAFKNSQFLNDINSDKSSALFVKKALITNLKNENLISTKKGLSTILKDYPLTKYSKLKSFYKFCKLLHQQRKKLNNFIELKIKSLLLNFNSTNRKTSTTLLQNIRNYNHYLKINNLFIKQLENWLTRLKITISTNSSLTVESSDRQTLDNFFFTSTLLYSRINKIDRYLNKLLPLTRNTVIGKLERSLIYVNFTILKQKLINELLEIQRYTLSDPNISNFMLKNPNIFSQTNLIKLNKLLPILKTRIIQLQTLLNKILSDSELGIKQPLISQSIPLKTRLQKLLKTNYQKNFIVMEARRKIFNSYINRFGGYQKVQNSLNTKKEDLFTDSEISSFKNYTNTISPDYLDSIQQKILARKSLKALSSNRQKFIVKKTIKKKMKKFLIDMALKNNYSHLFSLKNLYEGKTISQLCENFTDIQTLPKVSLIEFVKVKQPKQYAVCLANFVVENLEKRFSFRSTMKKAAEQAMSTPNIKGIKIQVSGRLNGAEIARTEWLRDGRVPLQTLRANIDYSYKTAKTIYGVLGVKVWIFKTTKINFNE